jgi:UDP-glucose 4-epimerase
VESERRPGDPTVLIGSSDKIQKKIGWNPVHNSLDSIIETAWQWQEKNKNFSKIS